MQLTDVQELHYITSVGNVASIAAVGILSHNRVARLPHTSVADPQVQVRRAHKRLPPGQRALHDYANLYFDARNPMMYAILAKPEATIDGMCVVRVDARVLHLPDVVIADANAAKDMTGFWPSPAGLAKLDREYVYAHSWNDPDPIIKDLKKGRRCAEVLVPDQVQPAYIIGVYVGSKTGRDAVGASGIGVEVTFAPQLFFPEVFGGGANG